MTLRGIITLVILAVLFALAVVWISRQGGWKGEGCNGNCASCHSHCEDRTPGRNNQNRAAARNTVQQPCFMVVPQKRPRAFLGHFSRLFAQNAPRWAA